MKTISNKTSLPIYINNDTRLSMFLTALLSPRRYPWFYERFVNLYIMGEFDVCAVFVDGASPDAYFSLCKEKYTKHVDDFSDDCEFICYVQNALRKKEYCYLWVDKYYICGSDEYNTMHFEHPILIFGYDNDKMEVYAVDFSPRRGIFVNNISYEQLSKAFFALNDNKQYFQYISEGMAAATFFRDNLDSAKNDFHICKFTEELENYFNSRENKYGEDATYNINNCWYGISIYRRLINLFSNISEVFLPFKVLCDIKIQKQFLLDRLKYVSENYYVGQEFQKAINECEAVVNIFNRIILKNIKNKIKNGERPDEICEEKDFVGQVINELKKANAIELKIMPKIIDELKTKPAYRYEPIRGNLIEWNFTVNRQFGWVAEQNIYNVEYKDGLCLLVTGDEVWFKYRNLCKDISSAETATIIMRNSSSFTQVSLLFTTAESPLFDYLRSFSAPIEMSTNIQNIQFNLNKCSCWKDRPKDIAIVFKKESNCKNNDRAIEEEIIIKSVEIK